MNEAIKEPKALRLARYLREFVALRTTVVRDVENFETVLWFGEMPQEPECRSPAWDIEPEPGAPWLEVRKPQLSPAPDPPELVVPWIDVSSLRRPAAAMQALRSTILVPSTVDVGVDGQRGPPLEHHLSDHPEILRAYERFRPVWEAWSVERQRRDRIQSLYADLFRLLTQLRKEGEVVEVVLGLGLLSWRNPSGVRSLAVRRHVVTARVDLHFDPGTGTIVVTAPAEGAQLRIEDDMLEPDLRPDRRHYANVSRQLGEIGDAVWDRDAMHAALKSWSEALHPDSQWTPDLKPASLEPARPSVSFAPALILRKRTQAGMLRIYDAIIERLADGRDEVPPGWRGLTEDEDDADQRASSTHPDQSTTAVAPDVVAPQFPLPANHEQRRIVDAIERRRGVLVQGPPGTGKSHTIANLVCHLLATGKRVLITAETGRALHVLKDKLPEEIRPLCVSLMGQGGDAFSELNSAVQGITTRYSSYTPGDYDDRIAEIDQELEAARRTVARIDTELRSLREEETCPHSVADGAYQGTASAIAERVAAERSEFDWLHLPLDASDDRPATGATLSAWLRIRRLYDEQTVEAAKLRTAPSETLPTPSTFASAVIDQQEACLATHRLGELRNHAAYPGVLALSADKRDAVGRQLRDIEERRKDLRRSASDWIDGAITSTVNGRPARWRALLDFSREQIRKCVELLDGLGSASVSIPPERNPRTVRSDADAAAEHLAAGGKWTKWALFTPDAVKGRTYLRDHVMVDGQAAATSARLRAVRDHLDLRFAIEELERAWSDHGGLPRGADLRIRLADIREHVDLLDRAMAYAEDCQGCARTLGASNPAIPAPDWLSGQAQQWIDITDASAIEERHRVATGRVTAPLRDLKTLREIHGTHPVIGALTRAIEARSVAGYSEAYAELLRVEETRRHQRQREETEAAVSPAVPGLVEDVSAALGEAVWDDRFARWEQAWAWAVADRWLQKRGDRDYQRRLWQRRGETDAQIHRLIAESASLRAWTHFFNRLSIKESAALKSWREAVKAMGKGTGRSAKTERLRREARHYMDECRDAVPVWIMPRYLVAEMVDPAPGRYDLVIVDEASQLGIESLFLFYIAKKMVVVGDDQQISPYGVGISDDAIAGLQQQHLDGIPHLHALSAQSSLYGNAKIRFGQTIVLREHFRCMPEIIQFSNDLCYASNGTPLDPLRAYPANRLKPVVVRHVAAGFRTGSTQNALNEAEADAVVAQIRACIDDPRYADRTMGVISLQGDAQTRLIEQKLLKVLQPEVIEARRLICGDAYAFQGDERSVIFLSMVAAPNERIGVLADEKARQRFNVAASRAQDQLWLFHSATLEVLSPTCMRHRLLGYMLNPGRQAAAEGEQRFESEFERHVWSRVTDRGFHVRTQVSVGDATNHRYRIDLVVEGMRGRLAVECDGDKWHGPERYEQDMARQRDLERAGWQFVRIRGSVFYRDPLKAMDPVWDELRALGIEPGGIDEASAEPPAPAASPLAAPQDADDAADDDLSAESGGDVTATSEPEVGAERAQADLFSGNGSRVVAAETETSTSPFVPYVIYEGPAGEDPRTAPPRLVADGLCRIIEVEGPMTARRAYDVYLRGCGVRRMGHEIRKSMDKGLASAVRQGRVISENETGRSGLLFSTVRLNGAAPVRLRRRGPRTFEEIPRSELQAAAKQLSAQRNLRFGGGDHIRTILDSFDLKRLTTQVSATLREVFERKGRGVNDEL